MKVIFLAALVSMVVAGCFPFEQSHIKDQPFVPDNIYRYSTLNKQPTGSLWPASYNGNLYFGDHRAGAMGDLITIKIVETTQADEKATTDTGKKSAQDYGIPYFFGYPGAHPPQNTNPSHLITANATNTFDGTGETTRTGTMTATISAKVVEVFPNGNLAVEGKREIYVNSEKKEILLQGIVRPKDIASDNSVLSTQVADAKIMMTGIGVVSEKQRPGWFSRILDGIWPF
ncbi:MAG TPA: flagellar basal body L-ring protein FlgH [Syntrophorhabdales bacterium]|nr:flagellar basal body L-ring protein FlgH [Syntrophorhabdales bacterium]